MESTEGGGPGGLFPSCEYLHPESGQAVPSSQHDQYAGQGQQQHACEKQAVSGFRQPHLPGTTLSYRVNSRGLQSCCWRTVEAAHRRW